MDFRLELVAAPGAGNANLGGGRKQNLPVLLDIWSSPANFRDEDPELAGVIGWSPFLSGVHASGASTTLEAPHTGPQTSTKYKVL